MAEATKAYIPLEANPELMTTLLRELGPVASVCRCTMSTA